MAREATGEIRALAGGRWEARIRVEGKVRTPFLELTTCTSEDEARERCAAMAAIAVRLRTAGKASSAPALLALAAVARSGKPWTAIIGAADKICAGGAEVAREAVLPTFEGFAETWTDGSLHAKYRDHVPAKDARRDKELLRLYVNTQIGPKRIDMVTLDDAEFVMASLPEALSKATRRHIAQVLRRTLALAAYPARLIAASPIPRGWLPKLGKKRARAYLYPADDKKLMACTSIPLHRRMLWGFLAREGTRGPSEALSFRWRHFDLEVGTVRLDENKTDDPRTWALRPDVVRALVAWRKLSRGNARDEAIADERIFVNASGLLLNEDRLAEVFRADLRLAEITRPELFEDSAARQRIRAHDLRATFITLALALGRNETWVTDRTGHTTSAQLMNYRRAARTVSELALGDLSELDVAIPEFASTIAPTIAPTPKRGGSPMPSKSSKVHGKGVEPSSLSAAEPKAQATEPPSRETNESEALHDTRSDEIARSDASLGQSGGNEMTRDVVGKALAEALAEASAAGRWDVVAELARELDARRRDRDEVIDLAAERKRRGR